MFIVGALFTDVGDATSEATARTKRRRTNRAAMPPLRANTGAAQGPEKPFLRAVTNERPHFLLPQWGPGDYALAASVPVRRADPLVLQARECLASTVLRSRLTGNAEGMVGTRLHAR